MSKWRRVDIYEKNLNFLTMTPKEVHVNASRMTLPNKEKYLTTLKNWEETFDRIDVLRKTNQGNSEYLKFLDENERNNKELYHSVRRQLQYLYDKEVNHRQEIRKKIEDEKKAQKFGASCMKTVAYNSHNDIAEYPDFDAMMPHQVIDKLNEIPKENVHYNDVQNVMISLKQFVDYFDKIEARKHKHAEDGKYMQQMLAKEKKNMDIFHSNLAAAKHVYGIAMGIYIPIDEEAIRNDKRDTSHMFIDEEFPPSRTNINWEKKRVVAWRRPCQLVDDPQFIVDGLSLDDIIQGSLGDCYIISSLTCLSLRTHLLESQCFVSQDIKHGEYVFQFQKDGNPVQVTVDDLLPLSINGKLASAHSKTKNEFWVALLEKAYAKFCGGYDKIGEGGSPADALVQLCGGKKVSYHIAKEWKTVDQTWTKLMELHNNGALLSCYAEGDIAESVDAYGIIYLHAYSILNIVEVTDSGKQLRLLQLRNPWGDKEWNGPYSDGDANWTPLLIEHLKAEFVNDGIFYIEVSDFFKEFEAVEGVIDY